MIELYGSGTAGKWDPSPNFDWDAIGYPRKDVMVADVCSRVKSDRNIDFDLSCYSEDIS